MRIEARGIFPGAEVVRGHDWRWGNQDGKRLWFESLSCHTWYTVTTNLPQVVFALHMLKAAFS